MPPITSRMEPKLHIAFEFTCIDLPARSDLRLGLQEGRAVIQDVSADVDQAVFTFALNVQPNRRSGVPQWSGPCAQGTVDQRFVYLCWGTGDDNGWTTISRAKILLDTVSWAMIYAAHETNQPVRANIVMRTAKGLPATASLKDGQVRWGD